MNKYNTFNNLSIGKLHEYDLDNFMIEMHGYNFTISYLQVKFKMHECTVILHEY